MKEKLVNIIICLFLAAAILSLFNCGTQSFSQSKEKKEAPGTPVEVTKVTRGNISAVYSGTTTLETDAEAVVVAKIGGIVQNILAEEGENIKKGQPLAKLEDDRLRLELKQANALLQKLQNQYTRKETLFKDKVISSDDYEQIKYEVQTQESNRELAQLKLAYTTIRAPFSGVVAERFIKLGNMVQVNQPAFKVTNFDALLAVLHVPERAMSRLKKGFPAGVHADALPGTRFRGAILRISPVVDAGTGTFKVTVEVKDPSKQLKPGMFTRVRVVYDTHPQALLVPRDTILSEDSQDWVFVVKDGVAVKTEVTTGYNDKTNTEILTGIEKNDAIVTTGLSSLKDRTKVEII